jgi:hypothetical protein
MKDIQKVLINYHHENILGTNYFYLQTDGHGESIIHLQVSVVDLEGAQRAPTHPFRPNFTI